MSHAEDHEGTRRDFLYYATAGAGEEAGVYVFNPAGALLNVLKLPGDPTNCTFGSSENENDARKRRFVEVEVIR